MRSVRYLGKTVGHITIDKRYISFRRPEHYFIKYQGFGMSTGLLHQLKTAGVHTIIIIYTKKDATQSKYSTPINTFYEKGTKHTDKEADTQLILAIKEFTKAAK